MDTLTGNCCTDIATMKRRQKIAGGMKDKHRTREEPCEGNFQARFWNGGGEAIPSPTVTGARQANFTCLISVTRPARLCGR